MRINDMAGSAPLAAVRPRRRQAGFTVPDNEVRSDGADEVAAPAATAPTLAVAASQADAAPAEQQDKVAAEHGEALLDALTGLQLASLRNDDRAALERLAVLADGNKQALEPSLRGVLDAIAARVAVQLERRSR